MAGTFAGQWVMITGANGNVGQAVARRFAQTGAKLLLVGRSVADLSGLATEIGGHALSADVTDPASLDALVAQIEQDGGQINTLVHTVGGYAAGTPVHESGLDVWDKMMTLNARSVYVTCGRVARHMVEQNVQGHIIAVVAKSAYKGMAKAAAYSAAKAAAQRVLESMAAELSSKGITVNAIAPATIDTPQNRSEMPKADFSKWVQPADIADAIAYLSSEQARAITGITLDMNGRA